MQQTVSSSVQESFKQELISYSEIAAAQKDSSPSHESEREYHAEDSKNGGKIIVVNMETKTKYYVVWCCRGGR